jgi:hypothetical protein
MRVVTVREPLYEAPRRARRRSRRLLQGLPPLACALLVSSALVVLLNPPGSPHFLGQAGGAISAVRSVGPEVPRQQPRGSGYMFWVSGLPPNVSAEVTFGQFSSGGFSVSGRMGDGFGGGGGPLEPGTYLLYVLPVTGYIPNPASATYYVSDADAESEVLNVSVTFEPAPSCYQVFSEVGLPGGTVWWVIGDEGLAFFSNGSIIDALGCGSLLGVSVGDSLDYQLVSFPRSVYYPGGEAVPVVFGQPPAATPLPAPWIALVGVATGAFAAVLFGIGAFGREPPRASVPRSIDTAPGSAGADQSSYSDAGTAAPEGARPP